ncbi:MAG TPA: tetratricopeptide repeat protein [Rubricoccaceae bacterium]|nr:tetratricopeptide repeat protein [Rubricoccaceae bacterium]
MSPGATRDDVYAHWRFVDTLFGEALDVEPDERAAFLERACRGDTGLRHEVEGLLAAHVAAEHFLDEPTDWFEVPPLPEPSVGEQAGTASREGQRIGTYRLVERLGEGGMGTVWLAERADGQFEQRVALKLVRAGLDSVGLRRRFRRERQILARLNHPHIARLLDGGVVTGPTGDEQPYLVMEFVDGEPITAYCDRRRLLTEARLGLFCQVAEAVQYAHHNLVIHRDLKPGNILVTEDTDGRPQVKLLDFGIARLLEDEGTDEVGARTLLNDLTPAYAAPEQVRGGPITMATDVYALGVILYELLTGRRPYTFTRYTPAEVERVVSEVEPERPSDAVVRPSGLWPNGDMDVVDASEPRTPGVGSSTVAANRGGLRRRLRGDLDAIVLRALRKEPAARYATADALLEDIRRHLAGLPVTARPATQAYRLGRFVRRHRWGVAATTAFVVLLLGATTMTAVQSGRVATERDRARLEADKATRVTDFLLSLFEANDPAVARGDTLTAGALMERGLREADALRQQPDVQARMLEVIGRTYRRMGRSDLAEAPLERALALRRQLHPQPHPDLARSLFWAAVVSGDLDDFGRAEELFKEALAMQRGLYGETHPELVATLYNLGGVLHFQGRQAETDTLFQEAFQIFRRIPDASDPETMRTLVDMARYLYYSQALDDAEILYRSVLQKQEAYYGEVHPAPATTRLELARVLSSTHRYRESERMYREGLAVATSQLGERHHVVQVGRRDLAMTLYQLGRYTEAELLLQQVLEEGPDQSAIMRANVLLDLGLVLMEQGRLDAAEPYVRENVRLQEEALGAGSTLAGEGLRALGRLERLRGNYDMATAHLARARAIFGAALRTDHPWQAKVLLELAYVKVATGAFTEAELLLRETLAIQGHNPYVNPFQHAEALRLLGVTLTHLGRYDEAEPLLRASLRTAEAWERPDLAVQAREALHALPEAQRQPSR